MRSITRLPDSGIRLLLGLVLPLVLLGCTQLRSQPPTGTVLTDVTIVDVDAGQLLRSRSIWIQAGRIHAIGAQPGADWPNTEENREFAGRFVTPALYDLHVHVFDARDLQLYPLTGIQAVRNLDGWAWHLNLRDRPVPEGRVLARLFTSGSQLQRPRQTTAVQIQDAVERQLTAGYDWVKLYDDLTLKLLKAVGESQLPARFSGHLPGAVDLSDLLAAGVYDDIAHAEELLSKMRTTREEWKQDLDDVGQVMRERDIALTTTLVNNQMIAEQVVDFDTNMARPEVGLAAPLLQAYWSSQYNPWRRKRSAQSAVGHARLVSDLMLLTSELHSRGVQILAGTDASNPTTVPGFSLHRELELLVAAGLSPLEALRSATSHAADHLEPGQGQGRVRVGARANLLISAENPLHSLVALQNLDAVMMDGQLITRTQADLALKSLRERYARDLQILSEMSIESPRTVFRAIDLASDPEAISAEGLTSLVWFFVKTKNPTAALAVAEKLVSLYPGPDSDWVREHIADIQQTSH